MQRVAIQAGRNVRHPDPPHRFGLGQGLNVGAAVEVGGVHHLDGVDLAEQEDIVQGVDDKIHGGHIVVVDDDAKQRPLGDLLFQVFVDGGEEVGVHTVRIDSKAQALILLAP